MGIIRISITTLAGTNNSSNIDDDDDDNNNNNIGVLESLGNLPMTFCQSS